MSLKLIEAKAIDIVSQQYEHTTDSVDTNEIITYPNLSKKLTIEIVSHLNMNVKLMQVHPRV
jgi:hypothetical protein